MPELWATHWDDVLAECVPKHPVLQPQSLWWKYDAPEPLAEGES